MEAAINRRLVVIPLRNYITYIGKGKYVFGFFVVIPLRNYITYIS